MGQIHAMGTQDPMRLSLFDEVKSALKAGAIFSYDGKNIIIAWGPVSRMAQPIGGPCFYSPDFYLLDNRPWYRFAFWSMITKDKLMVTLESLISPEVVTRNWDSLKEQQFEWQFNYVMKEIEIGSVQKVVPTIFTCSQGTFSVGERAHALLALLHSETKGYLYGMWDSSDGMLGLSPELLFNLDGNDVSTMALAGTSSSYTRKDLLSDPKELREHGIVLEDICKCLNLLGSVSCEKTFEWNVGALSHLRTDIRLKTKTSISFRELIKLLHPTAALGLSSETRSWQWLKSVDSQARKKFGAPFGIFWNEQKASCIVAIRNIQWDKNTSFVGSGCGVVKQSQFESEWQELQEKSAAVLQALEL